MIKDYSKLKANSLVTLTGLDEGSVSAEITMYDMTGSPKTGTQTQSLAEIDTQLAELEPIVQEMRALRADVSAAIIANVPDAVVPDPIALF